MKAVRIFIIALSVIATCVAPKETRADVTSDVYEDARTIAEELITAEFAESATVWLVCKTGRLPNWYTRTLQRLARREWGQLKPALREETGNFAGDFVYGFAREALKTKPTSALSATIKSDVKADATEQPGLTKEMKEQVYKQTLGWSLLEKANESPTPSISDACTHALEVGDTQRSVFRRRILDTLFARDASKLVHSIDECRKKQAGDDVDALACALGRAVRAGVQGRNAEARAEALEVVTRAIFAASNMTGVGGITSGQISELRDRVRNALLASIKDPKSPESAQALIKGVVEILGPFDLTQCKSGETLADLKAVAEKQVDWKHRLVCLVARAAVDLGAYKLHFNTGPEELRHDVTVAEVLAAFSSLEKATESQIVDAIVCRAKNANEQSIDACVEGHVKVTNNLTLDIALASFSWSVTFTPQGQLTVRAGANSPSLREMAAAFQAYHADVQRLVSAISSLIPTLTQKQLATSAGHIAMLFNRINVMIRELEQLKFFSDDGAPDYAAVIETTLRLISASGYCADRCDELLSLSKFVSDHASDLRRLLVSGSKSDVRSALTAILEVALPHDKLDEDGHCTLKHPPYRRITLSFVSYVLDESSQSPERAVTRNTFRAAAIDFLRCSSTGGLERDSDRISTEVWHTLARSIGLRASWNQAYASESHDNGYRTVVTLAGLVWHPRLTSRKASVYAGFDFSLVDWLAPFNELALRKTDPGYQRQGLVFVEFLRPRADFILGLPIFSEHLAVSIGGSVRTVAPLAGKADETRATATPGYYTYVPVWEAIGKNADERAQTNFASFFEFNAGVHYMF